MKSINFCVFLLFGILIFIVDNLPKGQAALAIGKFDDPQYPGKCKYSDDLIISVGEEAKIPEQCAQFSCDTKDGFGTIKTCGAQAPPKGCTWGDYIDVNKPYPECCSRHYQCS